MRQDPEAGKQQRSVTVWALLLFALTGLCVVWLRAAGIDPAKDFSPAIIVIAHAPSLVAFVVAAIFFGRTGFLALLSQVLRWRVAARWYFLTLVGPLALVLLANLLYALMGGTPQWSTFFAVSALTGVPGPLFAGSLGEEYGWRGLAQPLLQKRYTALMAAVIVGLLWGTWHLWPLAAPGGMAAYSAADVIQTYMRLIATSILYAWLYNRTRGSLLLVMLAHAAHNVAVELMPATGTAVPLLIASLYLVAALVVIKRDGADLSLVPQRSMG